jgi:cell division protein FtsQ
MSQGVLSLPRRRTSTLHRLLPSGRLLVVAAVLLASAGGLYAIARSTSMFAVRRLAVQGASPEVAAQVRAALLPFDGRNLLALHGATVVRTLEALPTVVSAEYDRAFPHTLRVRVVPEQAVAVIRRGAGSWLASARGRVIAQVERSRYRSLPRIWLPQSTELEVGSFLDGDAGASARALRAFVADRFAQRVLWARVQAGQLTLRLRSRLELRFGTPSELALKIAVVRSVLPTLALPAAGGPTYLDVSVPERPVAGVNPQLAGRG